MDERRGVVSGLVLTERVRRIKIYEKAARADSSSGGTLVAKAPWIASKKTETFERIARNDHHGGLSAVADVTLRAYNRRRSSSHIGVNRLSQLFHSIAEPKIAILLSFVQYVKNK